MIERAISGARAFLDRFRQNRTNTKTDGRALRMIATSHPEELVQMMDKRKHTLRAQKERKKRPVEDPVFNRIIDGEEPGTTEIMFTYKGQEYSFTSKAGVTNIPEFVDRLKEYLPKAPECTTCDRIFLPGDQAAEDEHGLMHMYWDCCPSGILLVGRVNTEGKVIVPRWESKQGNFISIVTQHYPDDEEINNFYNS